MMRNLKYTAAFVAAVLFATIPVACTDDPAEPAEPTEQGSDLPVCWDVKGVVSQSDASRVIIDDGTGGTDEEDNPDNPNHHNFHLPLSVCCAAPSSTGSGSSDAPVYDRESRFAIGLFGDYSYTENGQEKTVHDFYRGDRLVYLPNATHTVAFKGWDTNTAMKYWHPEAKYIFRAYYPQRLYNYTVSTSDATTLAMTYPSRKLQYDLLLAVKEVTATTEQMSNAVELEFKHALAALRFQFKLNFADADLLTSVYLCTDNDVENDTGPDELENFFSQGTVVFGAEIEAGDTPGVIEAKRKSIEWKQDYCPPATEILYKWVPPLKYWYGIGEDKDGNGILDDKNEDGVLDKDDFVEKSADEMLEYWGWNKNNVIQSLPLIPTEMPKGFSPMGGSGVVPNSGGTGGTGSEEVEYGYNPVLMYASSAISPLADEDTGGIQYHNIKEANAYYGTELYYNRGETKWVSRTTPVNAEIDAYHPNEAEEVAAEGTLFCRNSGWLLIPPQESFGALNLCFTTKKGGAALYKVKLPKMTGTRLKNDGTIAKFSVGDVTAANPAPEGKDVWAAGYRYTYMVTISQSDYAVNVSIQDWNERKHSTEIIF